MVTESSFVKQSVNCIEIDVQPFDYEPKLVAMELPALWQVKWLVGLALWRWEERKGDRGKRKKGKEGKKTPKVTIILDT